MVLSLIVLSKLGLKSCSRLFFCRINLLPMIQEPLGCDKLLTALAAYFTLGDWIKPPLKQGINQ